jgi:hypothetical protein
MAPVIIVASISVLFIVLSVLFLLLPYRSRRSDTRIQRSIPHALDNGCAQIINFLGIVRSKCCGNRGSIIHPPFQFELSHHLVSISLGSTLCNLVSSDIGFVQIMHKIDSEFDEEVASRLVVVGIV